VETVYYNPINLYLMIILFLKFGEIIIKYKWQFRIIDAEIFKSKIFFAL
jgi:hypothetical protein